MSKKRAHQRMRREEPKTAARAVTRRSFLKYILAGIGSAGMGYGSWEFGKRLPLLMDRQKDRQKLVSLFEDRMENPLPIRIIPEYERTLDHALVVFDNFVLTRSTFEGPSGAGSTFDQRRYQEFVELLQVLPEYTTIHLMSSRGLESATERKFASLPKEIRERTRLCPIGFEHEGTFLSGQATKTWAQDVCEPALLQGERAVIIPLNRSYDPTQPRTAFFNTAMPSLAEHGFKQILAPVIFDGGNIIPDVVNGRAYLFMGSTDIGRTIAFYETVLDIRLTEKEAEELFKKCFGVDEVVVFGPTLEDYVNMADAARSGDAYKTLKELQEKTTDKNAVLTVTDGEGDPLISYHPSGIFGVWVQGKEFVFPQLKLGGIFEQAAFSYHVDMVMATHPSGKVSLVELAPMTEEEVQERATYYKEVHARRGLMGEAFDQHVFNDVVRDYLFVDHTISELVRDAEKLKRIYGAANVHRFRSTAHHARNYQAYANTLRFRDRQTGKHRAIMPVFPTQERWIELELEGEGYSRVTQIVDTGKQEQHSNRGPNFYNRRHFQEMGYEVTTIRNVSYVGGGNTNCLVNILS